MTARLLAFAIWAAAAATAAFWGLRVFVATPQVPAYAQAAGAGGLPPADVSRVLGQAPVIVEAAPIAPEISSRFQLVGVAAPRANDNRPGGVALIAVDGKPPRAYRVGSTIDAGFVLQAVHARGAELGPRGEAAQVRLELPPLPPPNTGTLPMESYGATTLPSGGMPATGAPAALPPGYSPGVQPPALYRPPVGNGMPGSPVPGQMPTMRPAVPGQQVVPAQPVPGLQQGQPVQEQPEGQNTN